MTNNSIAYRAGGRKRNLGEKVAQEFQPAIENGFDMVVKDELKAIESKYRTRNAMYEFDAKFEDIEQEVKERAYDRFYEMYRTLEQHPEYFYEIESLFAKLAEEEEQPKRHEIIGLLVKF